MVTETAEKVRIVLKGLSIAPGFAMGKAHIFKQIDLEALEMHRFPIDDIAKEENRLDRAVEKSIEQLHQVLEQAEAQTMESVSQIFRAQMEFLRDKSFLDEIKSIMEREHSNIEYVLANQIRQIETRFHSIQDEVIKSRFLDVQDAHHRILRNLLEIEHVRVNPLRRLTEPVVFIAERLLPSDVALLDFKKILGIVIEEGSKVSHVAIISQSMGIPAISNIPGISSLARPGDRVIINGESGTLTIHPTKQDVVAFRQSRRSAVRKNHRPVREECRTRDGTVIKLLANVGSVRDAQQAVEYGADGIGLLRPEFFYISMPTIPSLEQEYDYYRKILLAMKRRPVTVRLLDLGGDKIPAYLKSPESDNPLLGVRGVRYLLRNPELLHQHLRCILLASHLSPINILIPFVATLEDWEEITGIITDLCLKERVDRDRIRIGIMIEVPSAALAIESFIDRVDFVSIGTNDLVQYLFAVARDEAELEEYRQNIHPVVLDTIRTIAQSGLLHERDVSVCGQIAGDPIAAGLLVGAGVRSLSMHPTSIPRVRTAIERLTLKEHVERFELILSQEYSQQIKDITSSWPE